MEVNDFEILLIDVTFYLYYVQKLVFNVIIKNKKIYNRYRQLNGYYYDLYSLFNIRSSHDIVQNMWVFFSFEAVNFVSNSSFKTTKMLIDILYPSGIINDA